MRILWLNASLLLPLDKGGKIFEAMAAGRATVSTSIGAEGLPAEHGKHLVLADDPAAFADAVVALLRNSDVRRAIESNARALVTSHYDWSVAAAHLEQAILDTTTPVPAASPSAATPIRHAQPL
jgi:glycosyltransferase involved in cell wall biosynthesis